MSIKLRLNNVFKVPKKPGAKPAPQPVRAAKGGVPGPAATRRERPPHVDWNAVVDTFLWKYGNQREDDGRAQGVFHPSAGLIPECGNCDRAIVFDLICAPKSDTKIDPGLQKVFDNGHNRHFGLDRMFHRIAKLKHMGVVKYEDNVKLRHPRLPISGTADGIITTSAGHVYLLDYKTINSKKFAVTYGIDSNLRYKVQLNTYMGMHGTLAGYVIYENKDNQQWATPMDKFRLDFDPVLYRATEDYCSRIMNKYVHARKLPVFQKKVCDNNIKLCAYAEVCRAEKAGMRDWEDIDRRPEAVLQLHELSKR